MRLGDFEIKLVNAGDIPMDGGAMFGVVPKVIWQRLESVDGKNRIAFASNCLLIAGEGFKALIETGQGSKVLPPRGRREEDRPSGALLNRPGSPEILAQGKRSQGSGPPDPSSLNDPTSGQTDKARDITDALREIGTDLQDIDLVINTHYHYDHCGGNTTCDSGGNLLPSFPKARYVVQKGEWEVANEPDERSRPSYLKENFLPVKEAGLLHLAEGEEEVLPGIRVIPTPGHTLHHQAVLISSRGETAIFFGDLVPTSSHVRIPYVAAYDLAPLDSMRMKEELYSRVIEENWLAIWVHDTKTGAGYMGYDGKGRPKVREFVGLQ